MDPRGTGNFPVPAARLQQKQKAIKFRNSTHQNKGSVSPRMRTRGEKQETCTRKTNQSAKHPDTLARPVQMGGTPNQKDKMLGGHHARARPGSLGTQPDYTLLGSALLQYPSTPRRVGAAGPRILTSLTRFALCVQPPAPSACPGFPRSRTRTESREGPALRASGNGIGRKAARVPPRAGRGGLSRLAGPAPAGFPGSGCVPGGRPPEREQKIGLALCRRGYSSFRPDAAEIGLSPEM